MTLPAQQFFFRKMFKFEVENRQMVGSIHRYYKYIDKPIDIERPKIDCLSFVMCPLLAQLKIGFFSFFVAAAVYSTNEANKAGLKQSIF
jgi:hypothetical protein